LFILLTVTGIFLMFYYRPEATQAWNDISTLQTSVTFGLLVRNMHRWGAHLMVLSVFLHMARVFYHGAYKAPREFNWVIGVVLLMLTLLLSFTGYLLPWDQLAMWAVAVGTNMMGYTPVFGPEVRYVLLGGKEIGSETLLRWYVLHVLFLPFVVIDLVISSILVSMGMFSLPPVVVSTPLKLLLFILVGGWDLVVTSLAQSFTA
jgi:quinol-cytochrome oxidoreductase complex cytochrome b subunit